MLDAIRQINREAIAERDAENMRLKMLLAAVVGSQCGGQVTLKPDDFRFAILIAGNELTTRPTVLKEYPFVRGRDLGASFNDPPSDQFPVVPDMQKAIGMSDFKKDCH